MLWLWKQLKTRVNYGPLLQEWMSANVNVSLGHTFLIWPFILIWNSPSRFSSSLSNVLMFCIGGEKDKTGQVSGLLWHKTRTTIVIKLSLETLTKPVNAQTSRLPPLQLSPGDRCRRVCVCVEGILSLLCKCLTIRVSVYRWQDESSNQYVCVCVTWCLFHTFKCNVKICVTSNLIYSILILLYLKWLYGSVQYLSVFFVAAVDLCDALLGAFRGGGGGEGLLHPTGTVPQTALDAEGLVQLVHLSANADGPSIFNKCYGRRSVRSHTNLH